MPTYHYRCKNCNYDFTEQQSFTDDPITVCPECGEEQVRKVYSAVPIEFKGPASTAPTNPSDPQARNQRDTPEIVDNSHSPTTTPDSACRGHNNQVIMHA